MFKLKGKKIFTILCSKLLHIWTYDIPSFNLIRSLWAYLFSNSIPSFENSVDPDQLASGAFHTVKHLYLVGDIVGESKNFQNMRPQNTV